MAGGAEFWVQRPYELVFPTGLSREMKMGGGTEATRYILEDSRSRKGFGERDV